MLWFIRYAQKIFSAKNIRSEFYSYFYPLVYGGGQASMLVTAQLAYHYNWKYMYYFMMLLILVSFCLLSSVSGITARLNRCRYPICIFGRCLSFGRAADADLRHQLWESSGLDGFCQTLCLYCNFSYTDRIIYLDSAPFEESLCKSCPLFQPKASSDISI